MTYSVIDLITDPSRGKYHAAFKDLLRRKYLGDDVDDLLYNLDYITHISANLSYYSALYGTRRVITELFRVLGRLPQQNRLVVLADLYRTDRTVMDDLFDELVSFKKRLISEGAPPEIVSMLNQILSSINGKPEDVYRQVKHFAAMYDTWKELGDSAMDYFRMQMPSGTQAGGPTDTELAKVVSFVLDTIVSGSRVSSSDIKRFVGNIALANNIINEAKRRKFLVYNSLVRSWVPTEQGLEFIGRAGQYDLDQLVSALKR